MCGLLQVRAGVILEPPDQKTQVFVVLIALMWWFSEHTHNVFDEMSVGA
jgi:hypothetical protein